MGDLNKRIAEALGYGPVPMGLYNRGGQKQERWVVSNQGKWIVYWSLSEEDQQEAIDHAVQSGIIPDWEHDLNAAITLPLAEGYYLELSVFPDGGSSASIYAYSPSNRWYDENVTGAAASVCAAWLAWKAGQGEAG